MKKLYFALFFALCAIAVQAQTNQIASLFHDGAVELYYGAEALEAAYEAAVDGDAITLSAGTFNSVPKIEKAITIRGAGMGTLKDGEQTPMTLLSGNFTIEIPLTKEEHLTLEGICHTGNISISEAKDLSIQKCSINTTSLNGTGNLKDFTVVNSVISKAMDGYGCSGTYINSVISYRVNSSDLNRTGTLVFNNCLIIFNSLVNGIHNSTFENCILWNKSTTGSAGYLSMLSVANNCVWLGTHASVVFPGASANGTNTILSALTIFKDKTFYELDETGLQYLGTDGKQIGIYGGNMPFTTVTTGPRIKKFEVSPTTTADGKLSVEIEVGAAE